MERDLPPEPIEEITVHPVYPHAFTSTEHSAGELAALGDALGRDCWVVRFVDGWYRPHAGDGTRNEDWYGWGAEVLAPFDGLVERVHINPVTNQPGRNPGGRASAIAFRRDDGVCVLYGHVAQVEVRPGELVRVGQRVARLGNNGTSQFPHLHVGAWRGSAALQIRFDLRALGWLRAADPKWYYGYDVARERGGDARG